MFIPKMKNIPLWFVDVVAIMKNLQIIPLIFIKKLMNFRDVTKRYRITFRATKANPFSAKRNANTKKKR